MNANRNRIQGIFSGLIFVLVLVIWVNLAPPPFGGLSSYVMIAGASMEPGLRQGDLVLVREELDYRVGDVVTYRHPLVGPIIHRIIEREGDRFILQGDNNDWIDSYTPAREEIIGKLWLHIPGAGNFIRTLRSPVAMASLAMLISVGVFSKLNRKEVRGSRSRKNESHDGLRLPGGPPVELDSYLFLIAVLFLSALVLGIAAFRKPSSVTVSEEIPYDLRGEFNYTGKAPPGIYDTRSAQTGDPIYLNLTQDLSVEFSFALITDELQEAKGSVMMNAFVRDPHGWNRTIELAPPTAFTGPAVDIAGTIDLSEVTAMIETLEQQTGFPRSDYTLVVRPTVVTEARINSAVQLDEFSPEMTFRLDDLQLYLKSTEIGATSTAQLSPQENRFYTHEREIENVLTILGLEIKVESARWISAIAVFASLLGFAFTLLSYTQTVRKGEAAVINLRYGGMIVDINKGVRVDDHTLVEVGRMEDLARFAERAGVMILHEYRWKRHVYYVQDGETLFRYKPKSTGKKASQRGAQSGSNGKPGSPSKEGDVSEQADWGGVEGSRVFLLVSRVGEKVRRWVGGFFAGSEE